MKNYIVLPFKDRDGKYKEALDNFINPFIKYLNTSLINYELIIVEQMGGSLNDTLPNEYAQLPITNEEEFFNLGRTINIGFDILKNKILDSDIFMFHPVDLLPIDVNYNVYNTTKLCYSNHSPDGKFYKAMAFKSFDFKLINGFSNKFWGWGLEDDDLFVRLNNNSVRYDTSINLYERLCTDGNGRDDSMHYMPLYDFNKRYLGNSNKSGLFDLDYIVLDTTTYQGITKYIIK